MHFVRRHLPWLSSLGVGLILVGAGGYMALQGVATQHQIRDELRARRA